MARRVFYSFHYAPDCQRAALVRNMGMIEGDPPVSDNDWESVKRGGDAAIQRWIAGQIAGKSCAVVLIGSQTASRKWVRYEIIEAWKARKGVVGIYIHKLKNLAGEQATKGPNPFDAIDFGPPRKLSSVVKAYDPGGLSSQEAYAWINQHLANAVEEAIQIRERF
ncbi:MAG: TIR domain-containing protein [Deltaproteobacteria bacterium]|nr:TIR domain-containing protein [Deltaproteobacteria bacterium]